ncbi:SCO2523 family variant P-loop protein [Streptomyces sp. NPDC050546]|uniref:SCO2523 family variant P-loop protein n=1 Tax=Streptomyces sp. NPDC050546 TaxID=3365628 RepID=UPI0037B20237
MIIFATSDKGGTGRSVTCANIAYRRSLAGDDVAYADFDFGSPGAAAVFELDAVVRDVPDPGVHSYLQGRVCEPARLDVWSLSRREELRGAPMESGRLCLVPGDHGGGEFPVGACEARRCAELLLALEEEFDLTIVDLRAGRSYAVDLALRTTARPELRYVPTRWLVFHRWTRQHIAGAVGLVHGDRGILRAGVLWGHDQAALSERIRYVRTAVPGPGIPQDGGEAAGSATWLRARDADLKALAVRLKLDRTATLGTVPLDPVLQWSEQLITHEDAAVSPAGGQETARAFTELADALARGTGREAP